MKTTNNILVCPLEWGLGHATRDVPVIKHLLNEKHCVFIGASGSALAFLKSEFPEAEFIHLPGFRVKYAKKPFFFFFLLLQLPLFLISMYKEHRALKRIIKLYNIDEVISDNRYGLWNQKVKSVLITHQIFIQLPKFLKPLSGFVHWCTHALISRFDECWIPDYADVNKSLAGNLSHGKRLPANARYIDPLSRFQSYSSDFKTEDIPDVLALISGPEPHRSLFELEVEQRFKNSDQQVLLVCGKPGLITKSSTYSNIRKVSHLNTAQLMFFLKNSKKVIARSGYSTIMDLHVINVVAELSSTPGQTEQEYLQEWNTRLNEV